jgi:hypothetical protein
MRELSDDDAADEPDTEHRDVTAPTGMAALQQWLSAYVTAPDGTIATISAGARPSDGERMLLFELEHSGKRWDFCMPLSYGEAMLDGIEEAAAALGPDSRAGGYYEELGHYLRLALVAEQAVGAVRH